MERIVKIGRVELLENEAYELYESGKYIVQYRSIYQIMYSVNAGVYGRKIYYADKRYCPLTRRGRFFQMTGKEVNDLLGFQLVLEN